MVDLTGAAIDAFAVSHNRDDLIAAFAMFDRLRARLVRAVGEFDAAGGWQADGATSMTAWLRTHARQSGVTASGFVSQARRLRGLPVTETAALVGDLSADQVKVVLGAVSSRTEALYREAEAALVPVLAGLSVTDTTIVAGEWAKRAEALVEEPEPVEPAGAHLSELPDGSWQLDAHLSDEGGALVKKAIEAALTRDVPGEPTRTLAQRRGDALVDVVRWFLEHRDDPPSTRHRPHLDVVQSFDAWAGHGPALLSAVTPLGAAAAARLACDCAVHRVLAHGQSTILDYGTATRVVPVALFRVLVLRDRHCRFPGCDRPPDWCEAHHITPVSERGPTRQDNLALFCSRHHHLLHQPGWRCSMSADGKITITTPDGRTLTSQPLPIIGTLHLEGA